MAEKKSFLEKFKSILPEGNKLDADRRQTAETVLDPNNPEDVKRWQQDTSKLDLKGFDTKDAKELSQKEVINKVVGGDSADEVIIDEPDRFVDEKYHAGRLIESKKKDIVDYNSFIKVVNDVFGGDKALLNITENVKNNANFKNMFFTPQIQGYIEENTRVISINYLMRKFNIEPVRASKVFNHLHPRIRAKLYRKATLSSLPKINLPKIKSSSGKVSRTRWTEQETNIIRANLNLGTDKIVDLLKRLSPVQRSENAIRNKIYREKSK